MIHVELVNADPVFEKIFRSIITSKTYDHIKGCERMISKNINKLSSYEYGTLEFFLNNQRNLISRTLEKISKHGK